MQLFYAPDITMPLCTLPEEQGRHAVRVLRMGAGDAIHLTDGRGNIYTGRIAEAGQKRCVVEIESSAPGPGKRSYSLTMAVAPTKNADRYDWFLEKAVEVGVDRIIPVDCRHSERRTLNADRAERIVVSAMQQSLKAWRPVLEPVTPLAEVIARPQAGRKLIAHCNAPVRGKEHIAGLVAPGDEVLIMIGPEGDFSPQEVEAAVAAGFEEVTLGDTRLRTETAALMAVMDVFFINR